MADETLEWDLKVDADTSGGTRMDAVLGKLDATLNLLGSHLTKVDDVSRKAGKSHEEHGQKAGGLIGVLQRVVHQGFEPFLHKAKEIAEFEFIREGTQKLLELPGELAREVYKLGEELLEAAAKQERFGIAFRNSLGGEEADMTLEYIENIGHHTEFTQHQLKNMNLELAKSGFHGGDLARANEALVDLASMSANPEAGADAAMGALKRVMISGRLDARALRPFGINQKEFFGELSKETGIGMATLQKQMAKGKVDVGAELNSLYTVITNKTGKALGGAGADMEKTLGVRLKNLKEIPELLGEKLAGTKGYTAISDFVGRLADAFDPNSPTGRAISEGLESIFDTIGEQLKGIDLKEVANTITNDVIPAIRAMVSYIGAMVELVERLIRGAHRLHDLVLGSNIEEGPEVAARRAARREANATAAAFPEKKEELASGTKVHHGAFHLVGKDEAEGLKKGIPAFEDAGQGFGEAVEKGFRKQSKTHSPSEVFAGLGMDVAAGFASGIEESASVVDRAFARMATPSTLGGGAPGAGGGAPPVQVTLQQVNHIDGAQDRESIPDQIAQKINEIVPGALQSALEQVAMQTGSAA